MLAISTSSSGFADTSDRFPQSEEMPARLAVTLDQLPVGIAGASVGPPLSVAVAPPSIGVPAIWGRGVTSTTQPPPATDSRMLNTPRYAARAAILIGQEPCT